MLPRTLERVVDGGFFVVEHAETGTLVATCAAEGVAMPPFHPGGGRLGWLITDPSHTGRGLGTLVAAAVTNRLVAEGFERPSLGTEDFRLAAISVYLKLGWRPFLHADDMERRWRTIFDRLGRDFQLDGCVES